MTNFIPDTPNSLLTRDRTAAALTEAGFPVKAKTLATKATRGGGPPYRKFGLRVLYRWDDALAWAQGRLSATCSSSSERDAAAQHRETAISIAPSGAEAPVTNDSLTAGSLGTATHWSNSKPSPTKGSLR